jgi:putative membrane protein
VKIGVGVALLVGIGAVIGLVAYFGAGGVLRAVGSVGLRGLLVLCASGLLVFLPLGAAWRLLTPASAGADFLSFAWARAVRDAAADVLPLSPVGGMVLGARATMLRGLSGPMAFATSAVDIMTEFLAQIAFIAIGLCIWLARGHVDGHLALAICVGFALAVGAAVGFVLAQRHGARWASRMAAGWEDGLRAHTQTFTGLVEEIYSRPDRLAGAAFLHLVGWISSAAVVWVAIHLIGINIDLFSVIAMEGLICAVRSAAFFVPSGLGVQEAGYAVIAPLFGLPSDIGLAVSLLKRAREVITGVAVLALYQWSEGRRLLMTPRETPGDAN